MNIYFKEDRLAMLEDDEISDVELGFMEGYDRI